MLSLFLDPSYQLVSLIPKAEQPDVSGELFHGRTPPISKRFAAPWTR
jgi:hypothetical protein